MKKQIEITNLDALVAAIDRAAARIEAAILKAGETTKPQIVAQPQAEEGEKLVRLDNLVTTLCKWTGYTRKTMKDWLKDEYELTMKKIAGHKMLTQADADRARHYWKSYKQK